jgi:predicted ATPase
MKLITVQIADYKCIREPCRFDVSDITCLVGKNESGKTAVLEALYRLNPIIEEHGVFDVDDDFPRIDAEDYRLEVEEEKRDPAIVTRASFLLDDDELREMETRLPGVLTEPVFQLSRGYANRIEPEFSINESALISAVVESSSTQNQPKRSIARASTVKELAQAVRWGESEAAFAVLPGTVKKLVELGPHRYLYDEYFRERVPKFLYFDEFYQMTGHVNIPSLIRRRQENSLLDSDYPLLGIIELARLNLEEISSPKRALERANRLQGASNHLTKSIMKYWSQNRDLEMHFDIRAGLPEDPPGMQSGTNLWCHVYNARQKVSTLLGRRSRGFVWFFSFLAWFSQQKQKNIPLILLLDEPSLFLHAVAQEDLLRFIEDECSAGLQVLYTTQSPYMVDPGRMDRVRILEDRSHETDHAESGVRWGTQVSTDPLQVKRESIVPLEGALGYSLVGRLFTAPFILAVESVHDLVVLQTMSGLMTESGRQGLDERWTITPMGGSSRLPAFLTLMGHMDDHRVACLFDHELEDEGGVESLFLHHLLDKERIFTYARFANGKVAAVEDLFDPDFYLYLVNSAYLEAMTGPISRSQAKKKNRKIADIITELFESMPQAGRVRFSRYRTAKFLLEHGPALKTQISGDTFSRFEKLFEAVNAALGNIIEG